MPEMTLDTQLIRCGDLYAHIGEIFHAIPFDPSPKSRASAMACDVSLDHGGSLCVLMESSHFTSAVALLRLQYESVLRAAWLFYAASDTWVEKVLSDLTPESERSAKALPSVSDMLGQLEGKAPAAAVQMFLRFRDVHWKSINSFVHGGIHPLQRQQAGYPVVLLVQVLQNSNALVTMAAMMLSILTDDAGVVERVRHIQPKFADCLPMLLPQDSPIASTPVEPTSGE